MIISTSFFQNSQEFYKAKMFPSLFLLFLCVIEEFLLPNFPFLLFIYFNVFWLFLTFLNFSLILFIIFKYIFLREIFCIYVYTLLIRLMTFCVFDSLNTFHFKSTSFSIHFGYAESRPLLVLRSIPKTKRPKKKTYIHIYVYRNLISIHIDIYIYIWKSSVLIVPIKKLNICTHMRAWIYIYR